ncbi:uncharacterized protein LOC111268949 [Varroa jacobsoni]|uniref:uncharacterized protein LOC111268949 n=1 Tax=Varroa jacobsoni TaxID=62625 RepID=UPI000BF3BACA|nr:uncharacterized protein LOC111268949 [Varroa jacobsoni]
MTYFRNLSSAITGLYDRTVGRLLRGGSEQLHVAAFKTDPTVRQQPSSSYLVGHSEDEIVVKRRTIDHLFKIDPQGLERRRPLADPSPLRFPETERGANTEQEISAFIQLFPHIVKELVWLHYVEYWQSIKEKPIFEKLYTEILPNKAFNFRNQAYRLEVVQALQDIPAGCFLVSSVLDLFKSLVANLRFRICGAQADGRELASSDYKAILTVVFDGDERFVIKSDGWSESLEKKWVYGLPQKLVAEIEYGPNKYKMEVSEAQRIEYLDVFRIILNGREESCEVEAASEAPPQQIIAVDCPGQVPKQWSVAVDVKCELIEKPVTCTVEDIPEASAPQIEVPQVAKPIQEYLTSKPSSETDELSLVSKIISRIWILAPVGHM